MNRIIWFILFLFVFAIIGYCREFFFVHLNIITYEKYYNRTSPAPFPEIMNYFRQFSYTTLYYSKYIYTLICVFLYYAASYFALKKLTRQTYFIKLLRYAYLLILFLAGISMCYGYFINGRLHDDEYTLSRWLLGIAQSPIICLILLASEKLYNKSFPS